MTASAPIRLVDATMLWSARSGGVRRYLEAKRDWLAHQPGWSHTLLVPGPRATPARPGAAGVHCAAPLLPTSGGYRMPWRRRAVAEQLVALRPQLIEVGDPYRIAWSALDAAQRCAVPVLLYCHSDLEAMAQLVGGPLLASAARRYARRLYARFDRVLAGSRSMCERLHDLGLANVEWQSLGVDTRVFHPSRGSAAWRHALGLRPDSRVLLYAGRFAPEKHLDVLAAAVDRLGPPHVLVALGAGPAPPRGRQVRCLPFARTPHAVAVALASADAFVHAGDQETFGLSALEALACGTPLVVRRAAGLAELVDDAVGMGVERGSPADFAEAIEALFAREPVSLRRAARRRAEAQSWERVLPALLTHYRALLGKAAPASVAESTLAR